MRKLKIGILEEKTYASHLMERLNQEEKLDMEAQLFSSVDSLQQFVEKETLQGLLFGESVQLQETVRERVGIAIMLSEEAEGRRGEGADYVLYKYQPFSNLAKLLLQWFNQTYRGQTTGDWETKLIGVYSPVRRCGKTTFALAAAREMAEQESSLYVSLEPFSPQLVPREGMDLADVLYYLKQGEEMESMLEPAFCGDELFRSLQPMDAPAVLQQVTESDWKLFFDYIREKQAARSVIIDFDESSNAFFYLLEHCTQILMPVLQDQVSQQKLQKFWQFLEKTDARDCREKIKLLSMDRQRQYQSEEDRKFVRESLGVE